MLSQEIIEFAKARTVKNPGSRGGKYRRTKTGNIVYGDSQAKNKMPIKKTQGKTASKKHVTKPGKAPAKESGASTKAVAIIPKRDTKSPLSKAIVVRQWHKKYGDRLVARLKKHNTAGDRRLALIGHVLSDMEDMNFHTEYSDLLAQLPELEQYALDVSIHNIETGDISHFAFAPKESKYDFDKHIPAYVYAMQKLSGKEAAKELYAQLENAMNGNIGASQWSPEEVSRVQREARQAGLKYKR